MKKAMAVILLILAVLFIPSVTFAATASPWTKETTYGGKLTGKLDFGFRNTLGGWTELITEPREYHKEKKCAVTGFGEGLYNAVGDTIGGILHLATFPIPVDIPLPEGGVDLS